MVAGFAVYDVLYRRVPDRALVFFIPLAALAPVLQGYFLLNHGLPPLFLWPVATHALVILSDTSYFYLHKHSIKTNSLFLL